MLLPFVLIISLIRSEENKNLLFQFDFQKVSENTVSDSSGNGHVATLQNKATIYSMGKYKVLSLGDETGYLDLGIKAGQTFASADDFTISMYYRVHENAPLDNNGRFLWTFSTLESNEATNGFYSGYRLNAQRFATSSGGYDNEHGMEIGKQSQKGRWIHVAYTQNGKKGKFYINGIETLSNDDMPQNTENFATHPTFNWIGRAAFSWDTYLINTLVYDIRFYNKVLTADEILDLSKVKDDLDNEYMFGSEGDRTEFNKRITEAKDILSKDTSQYLKISVLSYENLLSFGQQLQSYEKLSQPFLDQLCIQFDQAKGILESSKDNIFDNVKVSDDVYDTDRGFVHPGGIHTEEDFERVRKQISEGNEKVISAFDILKNSEWSRLTTQTWPVEVIIRGEGQQNYINAARGAHIAYQSALRWKLENDDAYARHGVEVLMAWARICKLVSGNSNWALAAGIYGYEFAQAAEILRTFEGWSKKDFEFFKDWMIRVWALPVYSFLSGRLGTWENLGYIPGVGHGADGQRPGHYWSNWGLCNVLALQSIGILCDDVFLYNQALSFYKYDQSTQANWNTEKDLYNRGVMDYIDNLVPAVHDYEIEKDAYGKIGQMQESGRDQGHATFSLGLAVDICLTAWNQGDDLFSYHDNRLAAGIEFVAGYNNANDDNLPFVTYHYADRGRAWHNADVHLGPNPSARGQTRAYWGKIIGHYEGVKGVTLPYADIAYKAMGIDGGCYGGASGAYDHFGFSVLMNTRAGTATAKEKPTLLAPRMEYKGETIDHNELGALTNNFLFMKNKAIPNGDTVKLMPQLPSGSKDTGKWEWNTGQKTREITIKTDKSYVYRVTYTNENNVKSYQSFSIAVNGDCLRSSTSASAYINGQPKNARKEIIAVTGDKVTLRVDGNGEWGSYVIWDNGVEGAEITIDAIKDITITAKYINHCGATNLHTFVIKVSGISDHLYINNNEIYDKATNVVNVGDNILIRPLTSLSVPCKLTWKDGSSSSQYQIKNIEKTTEVSVKVESSIQSLSTSKNYRFLIAGNKEYNLPSANYVIHDLQSGLVLTNKETEVVFAQPISSKGKYHSSQIWNVKQEKKDESLRYVFGKFKGDTYLNIDGSPNSSTPYQFQLWNAVDTDELMIYDQNKEFLWFIDDDGKVVMNQIKDLYGYPFKFVRYDSSDALDEGGKKKGSNAGLIAGVVIGVVAVIAIVVVVVIIIMKKRKQKDTSEDQVEETVE